EVARSGWIEAEPGGELEEVVQGERREETRGAPGRQYVVRPREVVAQWDGSVVPEEDRACVLHVLRDPVGVVARDHEVLGRILVRERDALRDVLGHDDRAARRERLGA